MLGKKTGAQTEKNVHLCIDSNPLYELLKALLLEWGYVLTEEPVEESLLLISEGLHIPSAPRHILTLSSSQYQAGHRLGVPLTIEKLYLTLENHFNRTPRNHIRINATWPIRVTVHGQQFQTYTVVMADRGIRFISPFEIATAEEMEILIEQDDETYNLHGKVVYSIDRKEIGRGNGIEVGVVCTPQSEEVRRSIRRRIIETYLKRVRPALGSNLFAEALLQFNANRIAENAAISKTRIKDRGDTGHRLQERNITAIKQ